MKRKDLLINKLEQPQILSKTLEFLKKIKTENQVSENMEVYDDQSDQVLIEMDLHLGVFDVQNPDADCAQGSSRITQHSLNSLSDGAESESPDSSDSSSECDDASDSSSECDDASESSSECDDSSGEEDSSDGEQVKLIEEIESLISDMIKEEEKVQLVYKIGENGPAILKDILNRRGWLQFVDGESLYWNLSWRGSRYRLSEYESLREYQRLNHFPNTNIMTKKDNLFRLLKKLKVIYGSAYDYFPLTLTLPNDYLAFVRIYAQEEENGKRSTWICKPVDMSRGRGIFVFRDLKDLSYNCSAIVQRYVPNPLLISGYKFDLRVYVLVKSYKPLVIYFYDEGLVRFATEQYDIGDAALKNVYSHLTNTSINKFSPTIDTHKDGIGSGCKWKFNKLNAYFASKNIDHEKIWKKIKAIVILTLLPVAPEVTINQEGCFELYGFDILIDENLKPWLLEVNLSPALNIDVQTDLEVKRPLLEDLIDLMDISNADAIQAHQHAIDSMSQTIRKRDRRSSLSSISSKKSFEVTDSNAKYPEKRGLWTKIYPYDAYSQSQTSPVKIGDMAMKTLVKNIKSRMI